MFLRVLTSHEKTFAELTCDMCARIFFSKIIFRDNAKYKKECKSHVSEQTWSLDVQNKQSEKVKAWQRQLELKSCWQGRKAFVYISGTVLRVTTKTCDDNDRKLNPTRIYSFTRNIRRRWFSRLAASASPAGLPPPFRKVPSSKFLRLCHRLFRLRS